MKKLYDDISFSSSKLITKTYSTSFSLGIYFLNKKIHNAIYAIYGFVRLADEIVDSFHDYPKEKLLKEFKEETFKALEMGISINPVINSFQKIVNEYNIDHELIHIFLRSMEQDLSKIEYSNEKEKYDQYIVGSAEVVGLMCLMVFVNGDKEMYDSLENSARKLGAALQKVNFLRDVNADFNSLGRSYFPKVDLNNFSKEDKISIEEDIDADFKFAYEGIRKLPKSSKLGVFIAYTYYISLFKKIKALPPTQMMSSRVRINNSKKLYLACKSMLVYKLN
ncbi:MAG: phytoene/squalene synthase family protein [Flavobacteriales bacterium]|nr:phytoene/squalene synthase family protein [Flavobacteriales bacterium]